jgi:hypothetical protein
MIHVQEETWVQVLDPEVCFCQLYGFHYTLKYAQFPIVFLLFSVPRMLLCPFISDTNIALELMNGNEFRFTKAFDIFRASRLRFLQVL